MGREIKTVGQLLKEMLKAYRIDDKAAELRIREQWATIVGEMVSKNTTKLYLKKEVLFVHISSSVIRHEVGYHSSMLLERIEQLLGSRRVKEIRVFA